MARVGIAPGVAYLDRQEWGADPRYPRLGAKVPREDRTEVIIHHTVMADADVTANLWETEAEVCSQMRKLQTSRQDDLGADVPYNFVIFLLRTNPPSLYICEGRGEDRAGAHTEGHNTSGIGIAFMGDFENQPVAVRPYVPLINKFLGWLKYDPNGPGYGGPYPPLKNLGQKHPEGRKVWAHRDFKATACPGQFLLEVLSEFDFVDPRTGKSGAKPRQPKASRSKIKKLDFTPEELLPDPEKPLAEHSELQLLAMALFGEARGVPSQTRKAIGNVIINRALHPGWWGRNLKEVILKPKQFSCFNPDDPNYPKLRQPLQYESREVWERCCREALEVFKRLQEPTLPDPVRGANHYYDTSIAPPSWADPDKLVLALPSGRPGHEVRFYRL